MITLEDELLEYYINDERYKDNDELLQKIEDFFDTNPTLNQVFTFMKEWKWDLWGAIPMVFSAAFPESTVEADKVAGVGPSLNQAIQSNNVQIGIQAWLLSNYIGVSDTAFHRFLT